MTNEEFNQINIDDKINYLNKELSLGRTIYSIRQALNIGEKRLQREIKESNYKFNQKTKQYEKKINVVEREDVVVDNNTIVVDRINMGNEMANYLVENFDVLREIIELRKTTTEATTTSTTLYVDLIDDKHLSPKPKSIRINEFVYKDWKSFCEENKYYSKQDLISMALKEYMEKYNK